MLAWPHSSSGPQSRNLLHWIALLLCSEKRPVREGQILLRSDERTVNYLSCGRNIVQQETEFRKGQRNYEGATFKLFTPGLPTSGWFGRYCDRDRWSFTVVG